MRKLFKEKKLFKGGSYMRKYGRQNPTFCSRLCYTALCFTSVIMLMLKLQQEKQQACPVLTTFRAIAMEVGIHLSVLCQQ